MVRVGVKVVSIAALSATLAAAAPAVADGKADGKAEEKQDRARPNVEQMVRPTVGPSLHETGRIGQITLERRGDDLGTAAKGRGDDGPETPVRVHTQEPETAEVIDGHVNAGVVELEAKPYLRQLRECPIEIARKRQIPLGHIQMSDIALSFTIQRDGSVTGAQALATQDADDEVLYCIGRRMFNWKFTPPEGGPAKVGFHVTLAGAKITAAGK